ncbi:MAG TPA: polysaccharide deacetylase family protein [Methylomirabilota bacterium]|nr:polysaccharide deacetylase family protein [Methylomirabilota bacterium]
MRGQRLLALAAALSLVACASPTGLSARLVQPDVFESDAYIVTFARAGDNAERLAARFLGDASRAWMIEEYNGRRTFAWGQKVVIPRRSGNPAGIYTTGYQLVPVLVYHHIAPRAQGRLVLAASMFEQQMRYLKARGYRTVSLDDLIEHTQLGRQLPRRSVVLTFDDGYQSFLRHAYPVLKKLGFTATLFVYTDYVGLGRNALGWDDLRRLADEGFGLGAHSKTHSELRRRADESPEAYARRVHSELVVPLQLFQARLGRTPRVLAYPYGSYDDELMQQVGNKGYLAALTVRREGNPSFVHPLRIRRSQIFADMTLGEFARNLTVFHEEPLLR